MGFLDRLFGGGTPQHPPLEPASPVASRLDSFSGELEALAGKVKDALEAVPERDALYVFVGHPPKGFGVVRIGTGGEDNLIQVMREAKLPPMRIQEVSDQARAAYVAHQEAPRFSATLGGRSITVIDSEPLGAQLDEVFAAAKG